MELVLHRAYFEEGTNGTLFNSNKFLCYTIELPWNNNKRNISCVSEGCYEIEPRFSKRFKHHLILKDVKGRSFILFHPANNAQKELEGCIAPVTYLSGIGKGVYSKNAMQKLLSLVYQAKDRKETILLTIKSQNHEHCRTL
ncbi:DUF5675 family protein [Ichthyenterobacterium magnum]|uniref:DUF5675 domain-containing protein n=1 Tax=Ichthyenterobacterium magnum TaxID=1230530 RepID=A0A420DGP7_9FLAO|nr:DUF5675 family protein [Ichthyenterobacterium magnum]RKE92265.1 hypothetical protein BXY80_2183 [Ichthyenterobacterium magnum]